LEQVKKALSDAGIQYPEPPPIPKLDGCEIEDSYQDLEKKE
jgi:serine O-acetyltransferase